MDPTQILYKYMAAQHRTKVLSKPHNTETWRYSERPPLRFRASEAGSCPRRLFYRLVGCVPTPDPPGLQLAQIVGNVMQDVVRNLLMEAGIEMGGLEVQADKSIEETLDTIVERDVGGTVIKISSRADGTITIDDAVHLYEFKTVKGRAIYWFQQECNKTGHDGLVARLEKKTPYYWDQVQLTMEVFGLRRGYFHTFDKAESVLGFALPDKTRTGIRVDYDGDCVDRILQNFVVAQKAVLADEAPSLRDCPPDGSLPCGFCPFYYQCHQMLIRKKIEYPLEVA